MKKLLLALAALFVVGLATFYLLPSDKVEFVGVAMISQKEPIENGKKYLKEHSLSLNYYSDVDSSFQKYHEITEIPTLIFVDKDGKIVKKMAGVLTQEQLETYIKEIL